MSLLPLSTTGSIPGVIKDHSSRNPDFAHFLMDETDFKDTFKETLQFINQNLKRKEGFMNSFNVNCDCIKRKLRNGRWI